MASRLSRSVFGLAVLACGVVTVVWGGSPFAYAIGVAVCVGGIVTTLPRSAKVGAAIVGASYFVLSLLSVPQILAHPLFYASWGNFFYPFSLVIGAAVIFVGRTTRVAYVLMGLCIASFGIEQAEFLARTASLVPKWIPPSQMFWAIATCVPFALAAVAMIAARFEVLAARLFATMMMLFGVIVWIPILLSDPHTHGNWTEAMETVAIGAAAWILADLSRGEGTT